MWRRIDWYIVCNISETPATFMLSSVWVWLQKDFWGWRLDLLATLTHNSWLHLIIAPSLISTIWKPLHHTLSVFTGRFLVTASNSGHSSIALTSLLFTDSLTFLINSESEPQLPYDCRFTDNQFALVTSPLRLTTSNFIFQLNICGYSPGVTSSLTRGSVRRLQLLLVLASAVILGSECRGTQDYIL
jgi:hypothetical protein